MDLLAQRVEGRLAAGEPHGLVERAALLRRDGQPLQRLDEPLPVLVGGGHGPEAGEQRAVAERDRLLETALAREARELEGVDPGRAPGIDAHPVPGGHQDGVTGGPERPAQSPERAPQARPGAPIEHVEPEAGRQFAAPVQARVKREPRQQRPCAAPGGCLDEPAVDAQLDRAEELDVELGATSVRRVARPAHARGTG